MWLISLLLSAPTVTVLLTEFDKEPKILISADGPIRIEGSVGTPILLPGGKSGELTPVKEGIRFQERLFPGHKIRILPDASSSLIKIGKSRYRGSILIEKAGEGFLRASNQVGLEDYLRGVVGGEMPADSAPEALAAQTIAARTYVLGEMARGKPIFDSVASQVYRGRNVEDPRVDAAVLRTQGLVLAYAGESFLTYFHSTCGGHTGDPMPILGEPTAPPLRGSPCGYCSEKNSKYYSWEVEIPFQILDEIVAEQKWGTQIQSMGPGSKDPWGRWTSVRLVGNQKEGVFRGDLFRAAVNAKLGSSGNLRSLFITSFEAQKDSYKFRGRGWGHGVGMCQIGAMEMAKLGFSFEQILARYYPDSKLQSVETRKN